jgi:hypothetical protein
MDFQKYLEKKKEGSTKVIEYDGEQWTIRKVSPLVLLKFEIFPELIQFSGGKLKKEIEFSLSKKTMEFVSIIIHSGLIDPKLEISEIQEWMEADPEGCFHIFSEIISFSKIGDVDFPFRAEEGKLSDT